MRKRSLLFLGAGLGIGLALGYLIKESMPAYPPRHTDEASSIQRNSASNNAPPVASREKMLLLEAIHELDLTTAELEEARTMLEAQKERVRRYDQLAENWKKNGFGYLHMLNFGWGSHYPSKELADFFGWNEDLVEKIRSIGNENRQAIKKWEAQNAVYVETEKDALIYELPAAPDSFKTAYMEAMADVMPPEDLDLLSSQLEKNFDKISNRRTATLTIGQPPEGMVMNRDVDPSAEWMIVKVITHQDTPPYHSFPSTSMMPYEEGRTIPHQWNHIFKLELDQAAGGYYHSAGAALP